MNFKKNSHFALFGSFGICTKDTNFINGTPHTHRNTDTYRHIHTQTDTILTCYTFSVISMICHACQRY